MLLFLFVKNPTIEKVELNWFIRLVLSANFDLM